MKPRNKYEWFTFAWNAVLMVAAVPAMIAGLWELAFYLTVLGLIGIVQIRQARRRYMDGWMDGRHEMLGMQMFLSQNPDLTDEQRQEMFARGMVERDVNQMRVYWGDREAQRFIDSAVKHIARSDGSHDKL